MKILGFEIGRAKPPVDIPAAPERVEPVVSKRNYAGAQSSARYSDFKSSYASANTELYPALAILRNRSRNLVRNNPHAKRFVQLMVDNVIGHMGIQLRFDADNTAPGVTDKKDDYGNAILLKAHKEWSETVTADGLMDRVEASKAALRAWCTDGEAFAMEVVNPRFKDGLAYHIIEADQVDENLNRNFEPNGNRIVMGIELDSFDAPVAYHVLAYHPGEYIWSTKPGVKYTRVPASKMIHMFIKSRPGQVRGEPPMAAIMTDAKMLAGYREAEITNRRIAAAKGGFFEQKAGAGPVKGIADDQDPATGELVMEVTPGKFSALPPGWEFKSFDAAGSTTDYVGFERQIIRSIAVGLGPSYFDLGMDLDNVSYSSIRQGVLGDRDFYRGFQQFVIRRWQKPMDKRWLEMALDFGNISLPAKTFAKFASAMVYRPRGWDWIDPSVEVKSAVAEWNAFMTSLDLIAADHGQDGDAILAANLADRAKLESLGYDFKTPQSGQKGAASPDAAPAAAKPTKPVATTAKKP